MKHSWIKKISYFIILVVALCSVKLTAEAANTLFDVPTFGLELNNLLYENTSSMIQATSWGYGTEANIINTIGIEDSIAELHEHVSPSGRSTVSIYTNGAEISGAAIDALAAAGWKRMSWYFYDYMVEGNPEAGLGDQSPVCAFVEDETVKQALEQVGFDGNYEMVSVSGWEVSGAYITLFTKDTIFSRGTFFDVYKYNADTNSFTKLEKQGGYDYYYFQFFDVPGDGIYVATDKALTEEQMAPREPEIPKRTEQSQANEDVPATTEDTQTEDTTTENTQQSETGTEENTDENIDENAPSEQETSADTTAKDTNIIASSDGKILWNFNETSDLSDFTPEATIESVGENEIAVSFVFDGELPSETQVTITLPEGAFSDGTMLHLFYCNQENNSRELVDSQKCNENKVTFSMSHCSDYIITSVSEEKETLNTGLLSFCVIGTIALIGIAISVVIIKKKNSSH